MTNSESLVDGALNLEMASGWCLQGRLSPVIGAVGDLDLMSWRGQTGPRQTTQTQPNLQPSLTEIDEEHERGGKQLVFHT